ncbi:MAG: hypothetical protein AAF961_04740, partial [Planctomycetota bacterium]
RYLPYGRYMMTVRVPDGDATGWLTTRDAVLEFGGAFAQTLVAPSPGKRAAVEISGALNASGLEGLRFGSYASSVFLGGNDIGASPEPGRRDDRFARFPSLGNGITEVGLSFGLVVERSIVQATGEELVWYWGARGQGPVGFPPTGDGFLLTDDGICRIKISYARNQVASSRPRNFEQSEFFNDLPEGCSVPYLSYFDRQEAVNPLLLTLPSGKLRCSASSVGKASEAVVQSLGIEPEAGHEIWLEAKLKAGSRWLPRAIDISDWNQASENTGLCHATFSLEPGATETIRFAAPNPSNGDAKEVLEEVAR